MIGAAEPSLAGPGGQDVYLEVTLNGAARGLVHFGDRDRQLWASAASLRQLGFVLPAGTPDADPVPLASLAGLAVAYDAAQQRVSLTAPLAMLRLPETTVNVPGIDTQQASSSPGLLLNYDLFATSGAGTGGSLSAFTEWRAFNRWGVLSHTMLSQYASGGDAARRRGTVRLDTQWSRSWPERMLTLRVGDTLSSAVGFSRATRIGGIQLGSNFALQPYLVTTPVPVLLGSAVLPSQLDLYVNGMRQYNGQVPAGPFQLNTLPSISGAGNAQVVLTDAFGRTTLLSFSLYGSQALLKKGLSSWSVELGRVRQNYGLKSNDYVGDPMLSGSWRHGLSDTFTVEAHGEATKGLVNAGAGGAWLLPAQAGVLTGALAHSSGSGRSGSLLNLGYQWNNRRFHVGFNATRTQPGYRDVAALHGSLPARASGSATVGVNTERAGSFTLSYAYLDYPGQPRSRYASAGWFKSLGRSATLSATLNQDLVERRRYSAFLSLSWALDARTSASAGVQRDERSSYVTASARRSAPSDGGWGWNAAVRAGSQQRVASAEADYLGPYGRYALGADVQNGRSRAWGNAAGALVLMDGRPFAARAIHDAFALVSTRGVPDVPVLLENRRIGSTDRYGHLLVTSLNAYQNNQLGIDTMGLPANLRIERVKANATPTDRAGTLVRFELEPVRSALVVLADPAGQPLPLGSRVQVNGQQTGSAIVGYDGETYLDTLADHNQLLVQTPAGRCRARFDHPTAHADGGIPRIGPLVCTPEPTP